MKAWLHASRAAASTNATDRLSAIWAAFDVLMPAGQSDISRIGKYVGGIARSAAAGDEVRRGSAAISGLLAHARRLRRDQWLRDGLRKRLVAGSRSHHRRLEVAALSAYAVRSLVVHGQWGYLQDADRIPTHHAAQLTWQMVERAIEMELLGGRQDAIQAITARAITR